MSKTIKQLKTDVEEKRNLYWKLSEPFEKAKYDYAVAVTNLELAIGKQRLEAELKEKLNTK